MSITIKFHRIITYSQYIDRLYFTIIQYYLQPLLWSNSSQPPIEAGEFLLDKVKFVEKNDATLLSEIYNLSSFGTSGSNGVRKSGDYMKNYFISQYGAIKSIDFSPIFLKIMEQHDN